MQRYFWFKMVFILKFKNEITNPIFVITISLYYMENYKIIVLSMISWRSGYRHRFFCPFAFVVMGSIPDGCINIFVLIMMVLLKYWARSFHCSEHSEQAEQEKNENAHCPEHVTSVPAK